MDVSPTLLLPARNCGKCWYIPGKQAFVVLWRWRALDSMSKEMTPTKTGPKRLGDLLVESNILSDADLQKGLDYGKKTGMALGKVLSMLRLVDEQNLRAVLHIQNLMKFEYLPGALGVRALKTMQETRGTIEDALKQHGWQSDRFKGGVPARLQELKSKLTETETRLGPDHVDMGQLLLSLAEFYEEEEMWPHAEGHCHQAIEKLEKSLGASHLNVATAYSTLGRLLFMQDRFPEAQECYQRAFDTMYAALGADNLDVAKALNDLAEVTELQGKYGDSEKYYLQSISIREKYIDIDEPQLLDQIKRLAFVCGRRGRAPDPVMVGQLLVDSGILSEEKLPEALEYGKRNNLPLVRALISMEYVNEETLRPVLHAQVLIKSNLLPAPLAARIMRLCAKRKIGVDQAMALVGWTLKTNYAHNVAELLATHDSLIAAEKLMPADSPEIANLCVKLGDLYTGYERHAEAEPLYKRGLAILEKKDTASPELLNVLEKVGQLCVKQQRFEQAESIYKRVLQMRSDIGGGNDAELAASYLHIGQMYLQKGEHHTALFYLQKALPIAETKYGDTHAHVGEICGQLATSLYETGEYGRAEPLFWRAFKIKREYLDLQNPEITALLTMLADLYNKQGQYNMADSVMAMFAERRNLYL
jgi:tetratricopeptide (TPR) repeat protein